MYIVVSSSFLTGAIVFALISIPIRHNLRVGLTQLKSNEAIVFVKIKPSEAVVLTKNKPRQ